MKTWAVLFLVVMATIVMAAVAMEDEENEGDWFDNFVEEYKRRPRPPPRHTALKTCIGYGKPCTIRNRQHGCCAGMGCYGGQGNDCTRNKNCICRKTPELKYVYYMV